jgi:hypothetical protein
MLLHEQGGDELPSYQDYISKYNKTGVGDRKGVESFQEQETPLAQEPPEGFLRIVNALGKISCA